VAAAAVAAGASGGEEVGGEHTETAHRVLVHRTAGCDGLGVATQDLVAVGVRGREPARMGLEMVGSERTGHPVSVPADLVGCDVVPP